MGELADAQVEYELSKHLGETVRYLYNKTGNVMVSLDEALSFRKNSNTIKNTNVMFLNRNHSTTTGETMLISTMDNEHLQNTIQMNLRNLAQVKARLENDKKPSTLDFLDKRRTYKKKDLQEMFERFVCVLEPYILELFVRDLPVDNIRKTFRGLLERKGPLSKDLLNLEFEDSFGRLPKMPTNKDIEAATS